MPTNNNGENVYDSSKSICEFNNHSIRTMKEKVNNFLNFCEYGGSIVEEGGSEATLPTYKFFVNGRKLIYQESFSMPGYPDDITLEQSLEIF